MERIEILTGEQPRRRYTPQEKARFIAMTLQLNTEHCRKK